MLIGLTPARTDFFTGFMLKKNSNKLLHLFLNLVFLKKVFEVTLFYGTLNLDPDPGFWLNLDPDPGLNY